MDANIKELANTMWTLVDSIGNVMGHEDFSRAARMEVAQYLMYLSASDGEIKWSESIVISEILGFSLSPSQINDFIREKDIYSVSFESTIPAVFKTVVDIENKLYAMGHLNAARTSAAEGIVLLYKCVGDELLKSDGIVDDTEKNNFVIFIRMLENYLDANLYRRASGVKTNFNKESGSASAPMKSGVSAPQKKG